MGGLTNNRVGHKIRCYPLSLHYLGQMKKIYLSVNDSFHVLSRPFPSSLEPPFQSESVSAKVMFFDGN